MSPRDDTPEAKRDVKADNPPSRPTHFLAEIIAADLASNRDGGRVVTRFPPEPNGFLHIGHAKSICLNFGLADAFGGQSHLRMDDTNPTAEDVRYVEAIERDVAWLGFRWTGPVRYASDSFETMYNCAVRLIRDGKAYVDSQSVDEIRAGRGGFGHPGVDSPFRMRDVAENLDLFTRMRAGEFADGSHVLRARIDMTHPNLLLRDPLLYRIRHAHHHRTGDAWCIYPMYDYAHPLEDAIEGITHSICTLEFESNREFYDWVLDQTVNPETDTAWSPRPRQHEFARLALAYTVVSKRKLLQLVTDGTVTGWDDPRMPTIAGLRRRGVSPEALRDFADLIGVAKNNSLVDLGKLEFCIRQDLEKRAPRALAVLAPLKLELTTWPDHHVEALDLPWWPGNEPAEGDAAYRGTRPVPFGRQLLIERDDFSDDPPPDWKRLALGREVRLLGAYFVRCDEVVRDPATGEVVLVRCSHDPETRGGVATDGRSAAGTLHWLHEPSAVPAELRLYDRLFAVELPDDDGDFHQHLTPGSRQLLAGRVEPAVAAAAAGTRFQFMRQGYFFSDPVEHAPDAPIFNRIIGLRDQAAKAEGRTERVRKASSASRPLAPKKPRSEHRAELRAETPELAERYERYQAALGLGEDEADRLTSDLALARFYDAAVAVHGQPGSVAKWLLNDLLGALKERTVGDMPLAAAQFGAFVALVDAGAVAPRAAKDLLAKLVEHGGEPAALVAEMGLERVEDAGVVEAAVTAVLAKHPAEVERFRAGEQKLLGVLLGAAMREVRGADAGEVRRVLVGRLG